MSELMAEMNAQMAQTPQAVQIWMNWMSIIFFASIIFVRRHWEARWALVSMIVSMPVALIVFSLTNTVHLLGIVHFLVWGPLFIYLIKKWRSDSKYQGFSFLRLWHHLLCATMGISFVFDVRDIFLVLSGSK